MTPEMFRQQEKDKQMYQKKLLDDEAKANDEKEPSTFMGLTDEEIMVNRKEFEDLGLL